MNKKTLSVRERLKKNDDIKRVFDKGVSFRGRLVSVFIKQNTGLPVNRAAFIIRKSLYKKKTVFRNRFRRIIREGYRNSKFLLLSGHDIVILANRLDHKTKSTEIEKELCNVFKKYTKENNNIIS